MWLVGVGGGVLFIFVAWGSGGAGGLGERLGRMGWATRLHHNLQENILVHIENKL